MRFQSHDVAALGAAEASIHNSCAYSCTHNWTDEWCEAGSMSARTAYACTSAHICGRAPVQSNEYKEPHARENYMTTKLYPSLSLSVAFQGTNRNHERNHRRRCRRRTPTGIMPTKTTTVGIAGRACALCTLVHDAERTQSRRTSVNTPFHIWGFARALRVCNVQYAVVRV